MNNFKRQCLVVCLYFTLLCVFGQQVYEDGYAEDNIYNVKNIGRFTKGEYGSRNLYNGTFIGFTAWLKSTKEYTDGQNVIFDGLILNEGDHYQPTFGRFICPFTSVYYVSLTVKKNYTDRLLIEARKDGNLIFQSYGGESNNPWNSVSTSALTNCTAGEAISATSAGMSTVYGQTGIPESTFTVILMGSSQGNISGNWSQYSDDSIGFSASKNTGSQNCDSGDTVIFNQIIYNEGNHFNPTTSRFLCPVDGIYFNSVTLYRYTSPPSFAVERATISVLHSDDTSSLNAYNTVTNCGLVRCEAGDVILVKATSSGEVAGFDHRELFSSMLMYEDSLDCIQQEIYFIGFTAFKQTNQIYVTGNVISFEGIMLNEGDGYQPLLNQFVCPVDGFYFISVNARKEESSDLILDLEMQTVLIFRLEDTQVTNPSTTISNTVVTRCLAGWTVQVKGAGSGEVYGHQSEAHTTFTMLLMMSY